MAHGSWSSPADSQEFKASVCYGPDWWSIHDQRAMWGVRVRCRQCGHEVAAASFCSACGASLTSVNRPPTPPIPPPPPVAPKAQSWQRPAPPASTPSAGERLAVTGKVVGLSGCMLALIFWVVIPLIVLIVAIAATSSTGFAAVVAMLALIGGFVYWVWKRTGT